MKRTLAFGLLLFALFVSGAAYAVAQSWRPAMPEVIVNVRVADRDPNVPSLMIIYGENGSDPFRGGSLGAERRISACDPVGSTCISRAGRKGFGATNNKRQSLQIRIVNGEGNPIVGGVEWVSASHPQRVRLTCDLRVKNARKSCVVSDVTV